MVLITDVGLPPTSGAGDVDAKTVRTDCRSGDRRIHLSIIQAKIIVNTRSAIL